MAQPQLLADAMQCPTPTTSRNSDLDRSRARNDAVVSLLARFEAASGVHLDDPEILRTDPEKTRKWFFTRWLEERQFSHAQYLKAEAWIFRGAPARFGTLTTADFYPTPEQLASVEFRDDTDARIRAAEQRGYNRGYRDGKEPCARCHEEEALRLALLKLENEIISIKNPF